MRYKAENPGLEAVAWYCDGCGAEISRDVWDTAEEIPQEGYLRACRVFNEDSAARTCAQCGKEHGEIDMTPYRWEAVAAEVREDIGRES